MTEIGYPSEANPAPPRITLTIPPGWGSEPTPGTVIAVLPAQRRPDFTPNVIVRLTRRPALDQPADLHRELAATLAGRADAEVGEVVPTVVGGQPALRAEVSWTSPEGLRIGQVHLFVAFARPDGLADFVQVTGSVGGAGVEDDRAVVEGVLSSVRFGD